MVLCNFNVRLKQSISKIVFLAVWKMSSVDQFSRTDRSNYFKVDLPFTLRELRHIITLKTIYLYCAFLINCF